MSNAFEKFDLTGKTAFVTGGSAGLGYFMARGLARSGAKVMIAARREQQLEKAAKNIMDESSGNKVLYCTTDLRNRKNITETAEEAISVLGGVDIFIGNAGMLATGDIDSITDEAIDNTIQVNLVANMVLARSFVPNMRKKHWGRLLFSSSYGSQGSFPGGQLSAYAATKGGINAYSRAAATELGIYGITSNTLVLGTFKTEMLERSAIEHAKDSNSISPDAFLKPTIASTALNRLGMPEDVEGVVQLLASDAGSYITGSEVLIDGGALSMIRPQQ